MSEKRKNKIMIVDDNVTNLNIARKALDELYDVVLIPNGEKALAILAKVRPDIILLDVDMPGLSGFDVIKEIKKMPVPICDIPVIFVTAKGDMNSEFEGLNLGAVDYIIKPFSFPLLQKRVELHVKLAYQQNELQNYSNNLEKMVKEKTSAITEMQYAVVHALSDLVEKRDGSTGGHIYRTRTFMKILIDSVKQQNVYSEEMQNIDAELYAHASQMHDVGKISISDSILFKEGRLTEDEFNIMKKHTIIGEQAISYSMRDVQDFEFLRVAAEFAKTHHEKWNGTGYPLGLKEKEIPISGRLMAIVDVYDALISVRPYKPAMRHEQAVDIILKDCGTHFDPELVSVFMTVADTFKEISQENAYGGDQ